MKEPKSENTNPILDLEEQVWQLTSMTRGSIASDEYHFIFFLLFLQKQGLLHNTNNVTPSELKPFIESRITDFDGEFSHEIRTISEVYLPIIKKITDSALQDIFRFLLKLSKDILRVPFVELFEGLLYRYVKLRGRMAEDIMLPVELSRFVAGLADPPENAKVYNPFAGVASFGIFLNNNIDYIGQEINKKAWALGSLRLLVHQRVGYTNFLLGDSIHYWHPASKKQKLFLSDSSSHQSENEKFDVIIADPPFGAKISEPVYTGRFGYYKSYEHFLIEKGLDDLKEDGKIVALLSPIFLSKSGIEEQLRRYLVEKDLLETVILLPSGLLFNTGVPLICIVINKQKATKGVVRFINADNSYTKTSVREKRLNDLELNAVLGSDIETELVRIVSIEDIRSSEYNLTVQRYFKKQFVGIGLKKIISSIKRQRGTEGQQGKFVRIRDLKDNVLEYQLVLSDIEETTIPKNTQIISESCLLIASRWKTLKPTYYNFKGTPIYISSDILAFTINESECDITYLINELYSTNVLEQVESYRTGSVISMIRREDLFSVKIPLPDLDKQKAIVKQRMTELANEKKKELSLFNKIHGLETEIFEQNTYLRHILVGPSSNLKDSIFNIKKIITDRVINDHPEILRLKISENHLITLGEYLEIIERDANKIVNAVASQLKVERGIDEKKLAPIEIIGFLEKYVNEYKERENLNFKIDFDYDDEMFIEESKRIKTYVLSNEDLLRDLLDNLIDNANKHAFTPIGNNRIEIFLMKNNEEKAQDEVQILFSNTGKPFPEDFTLHDFIRRGSKSGETAGEGFGGWYINEIIKKLNGNLDIIDETSSEGLPDTDLVTSFEINFPIIETVENEEV